MCLHVGMGVLLIWNYVRNMASTMIPLLPSEHKPMLESELISLQNCNLHDHSPGHQCLRGNLLTKHRCIKAKRREQCNNQEETGMTVIIIYRT